MARSFRKLLSLVIVMLIVTMFITFSVKAEVVSGTSKMLYALDPTSNFFTQVENKEQIEITDERENMSGQGYLKACENSSLIVYFKQSTCGIAVYDKASGYMWYSSYQNKGGYTLTNLVKAKNESGVSIEYYLVDTKGNINSSEVNFSAKTKNVTNGSAAMTKVENGFDIDVEFKSYGISFKIEIRLDGKMMNVTVPSSSITEVAVKSAGEKTPKEYKLKSIILFPYFGSENYEINGYSFIPDGSGALIRYTDTAQATAYTKKLYGDDYSFTDYKSSYYYKDNGVLSLPIYGVNHGYNQAAFLCELNSGYGSSELHSYPYMYNNIPINTTFFKYFTRDTFTVSLTSETMNLLTESPYPSDYSLSYNFLSGNNANYVGMANIYRNHLGLEEDSDNKEDIKLHLDILGIDYKPGLFGKNYIKMTTYEEAKGILTDLKNNSVNNFAITYLGWNRGGYFTKSASSARSAILLGGSKKLNQLNDYISENGYSIDYTINPLVSSSFGFGTKNVKRIGLKTFDVTLKSSMDQVGYYVLATELAKTITSKDKRYSSLGISGLNIDNLNVAYSYRYDSLATYRNEMINQITSELDKLSSYKLSTTKPNSYLLKYMDNYYESFYESNKYIYETDSIPFMSILLSGYVDQFMPDINYVSDYELAVLRMIEYNIYPSFIITNKEAYDLRYTNYEYLNSTEYSLWKDLIVKVYGNVNNALKHVSGAKLIAHEYVLSGVSKCSYDNGVTIYVNYNDTLQTAEGINLSPYSYRVIGGDD